MDAMMQHFNEVTMIYLKKYSEAAQMDGLKSLDLLPSTTPAAVVLVREGQR